MLTRTTIREFVIQCDIPSYFLFAAKFSVARQNYLQHNCTRQRSSESVTVPRDTAATKMFSWDLQFHLLIQSIRLHVSAKCKPSSGLDNVQRHEQYKDKKVSTTTSVPSVIETRRERLISLRWTIACVRKQFNHLSLSVTPDMRTRQLVNDEAGQRRGTAQDSNALLNTSLPSTLFPACLSDDVIACFSHT
jgi:hypothetical protein